MINQQSETWITIRNEIGDRLKYAFVDLARWPQMPGQGDYIRGQIAALEGLLRLGEPDSPPEVRDEDYNNG
jgi:hypothetical protein